MSVLNQILQVQATEQLKAGPYERTDDRQGYRNDTRPYQLATRAGSITLRVPRFGNGQFSTEMFAHYLLNEQALVLALTEMVVNGVCTRKVSRITKELCGTDFSMSTVSALCKKLDPIVTAWNNRDLWDMHYLFILVDALVLKVREDGRVRSRSAVLAIGINAEEYREVLGLMLGNSKSEASWSEFFSWLKKRNLRGVELVVLGDHGGLVNAVQNYNVILLG